MLNDLKQNLAGAWEVMRGREAGLARLDLSIDGFWRSFGAIVLVAPFAVLTLLSQQMLEANLAPEPAVDPVSLNVTVITLAFLVDWVAFPVVFAGLCRPLGLSSRYVPFIVARNWSAVIISAMAAAVHGPHVLGLVPTALMPALILAMLGVVLWFSYRIARTALAVPLGTAIGVVLLDFLVSVVIWTLSDRLA